MAERVCGSWITPPRNTATAISFFFFFGGGEGERTLAMTMVNCFPPWHLKTNKIVTLLLFAFFFFLYVLYVCFVLSWFVLPSTCLKRSSLLGLNKKLKSFPLCIIIVFFNKALSDLSSGSGYLPTATCLAMRPQALAKEGTSKEQEDRSTTVPSKKSRPLPR